MATGTRASSSSRTKLNVAAPLNPSVQRQTFSRATEDFTIGAGAKEMQLAKGLASLVPGFEQLRETQHKINMDEIEKENDRFAQEAFTAAHAAGEEGRKAVQSGDVAAIQRFAPSDTAASRRAFVDTFRMVTGERMALEDFNREVAPAIDALDLEEGDPQGILSSQIEQATKGMDPVAAAAYAKQMGQAGNAKVSQFHAAQGQAVRLKQVNTLRENLRLQFSAGDNLSTQEIKTQRNRIFSLGTTAQERAAFETDFENMVMKAAMSGSSSALAYAQRKDPAYDGLSMWDRWGPERRQKVLEESFKARRKAQTADQMQTFQDFQTLSAQAASGDTSSLLAMKQTIDFYEDRWGIQTENYQSMLATYNQMLGQSAMAASSFERFDRVIATGKPDPTLDTGTVNKNFDAYLDTLDPSEKPLAIARFLATQGYVSSKAKQAITIALTQPSDVNDAETIATQATYLGIFAGGDADDAGVLRDMMGDEKFERVMGTLNLLQTGQASNYNEALILRREREALLEGRNPRDVLNENTKLNSAELNEEITAVMSDLEDRVGPIQGRARIQLRNHLERELAIRSLRGTTSVDDMLDDGDLVDQLEAITTGITVQGWNVESGEAMRLYRNPLLQHNRGPDGKVRRWRPFTEQELEAQAGFVEDVLESQNLDADFVAMVPDANGDYRLMIDRGAGLTSPLSVVPGQEYEWETGRQETDLVVDVPGQEDLVLEGSGPDRTVTTTYKTPSLEDVRKAGPKGLPDIDGPFGTDFVWKEGDNGTLVLHRRGAREVPGEPAAEVTPGQVGDTLDARRRKQDRADPGSIIEREVEQNRGFNPQGGAGKPDKEFNMGDLLTDLAMLSDPNILSAEEQQSLSVAHERVVDDKRSKGLISAKTADESLAAAIRTPVDLNEAQKKLSASRRTNRDYIFDDQGEMRPGFVKDIRGFIVGHEGEDLEAYVDTQLHGKNTIGYGFNLDQPGAQSLMKEAGVDKDVKKLIAGKQKLTESEAELLLGFMIGKSMKRLDNWYGDVPLSKGQYIALTSMIYNNPSLVKPGTNFSKALKAGDMKTVFWEVAYNSGSQQAGVPKDAPGLLTRRFEEALAIAGSANYVPPPADFHTPEVRAMLKP